MKHKRILFLLIVFMSMVGIETAAHDIEVANSDGVMIYYNWINNQTELSVSFKGESYDSYGDEYTGTVVIPESVTYNGTTYAVTSLGESAFDSNGALTSVTIPNSVTSIGIWAFYECTSLTSIDIPNSITSIERGAFYGCTGLTSVTIPNSVTSIDYQAFEGCTGLTSVTIGNSVTSIGYQAFEGCTGLTSVTIGNSVTSIGEDAFKNCTGLTNVTIGNSVTSIGRFAFDNTGWYNNQPDGLVYAGKVAYRYKGKMPSNTSITLMDGTLGIADNAFGGCTGLTSVTIGNSLTSIGRDAFSQCTALNSVTIGNSVTSIGEFAFYNCTGLTKVNISDLAAWCKIDFYSNPLYYAHHLYLNNVEVKNLVIPNSVTSIGYSAFNGCTGLTSVTIPNSVTSIDYQAFEGCTGLTSVTIGNSVTSIWPYAFFDCTGLTSVTIPNSVTSIGEGAFVSCTSLETILVESGNTVYDSRNGCNAIIETASNTLIAGCKNTIIPNSVTNIGYAAFAGISNLTNICIPNSVTSIADYAFAECDGLTSVTVLGETPVIIGEYTFSNRTNATLYVPSGCKPAYEAADYWKDFKEIIDVSSAINFADANVKAICVANWDTNGDGELSYAEAAAVTDLGSVFRESNITSFNEFKFFIGLTSIGSSAFPRCTGLTSIDIPNSVTSIGTGAFNGCTALTSVTIPNSVTAIGDYAFSSCSNLTSITIPNSVTSIGDDAFRNCTGLTSVTIPNSVTSIGERAFYGCSSLTDIVLPNSVTSIEKFAFSSCKCLTDIVLPNSVTTIGDHAFYGSSLTSVKIPSSVTSIGNNAFDWCWSLKNVGVMMETPINIDSETFPNRMYVTLYVPKGCKAAYEAADYWKGFKEIREADDVMPLILFDDGIVRSICVANWDTDGDGELSFSEAAAVNDIGLVFQNKDITSFDELKYFINLTNINDESFLGCRKLTRITIPNSVTSIGRYAFQGCTGLTNVTLGNSVTYIDSGAFYECRSLSSIIIPSSVEFIDGRAFYYCYSLKTISVESGNTVYDSRNDCNAIIETASNALYLGCMNTIIPNSVTNIYSFAFADNSRLTSVTIPNSVTSIEEGAFNGCSRLNTMLVESGNAIYDSRDDCNAIIETASNTLIAGCKNTIIPNTVTSIGKWAFSNCTSLTSIDIPNSVTSIGDEAFGGCRGLRSVTIPSSVTSIGDYAFYDIYYHYPVEVTMLGETPINIGEYTFPNRTNATLYVPYGSKAAYEATDYWKEFKDIVEIVVETDISQLDNVIYIEPTEAWTNTQKTLSLKMKNSAAIRGFQFDLYLPEGVTVVKSGNGRIQGALSAGRLPNEDEHNLTFSEQPDGAIRFLCSSQYDETFTGNDGEIATLKVAIADNMEEGDYPIQLKSMKLTETNIANYYETALVQSKLTVSKYVTGDISGDGVVDVSDYTGVANYIHGNTPDGFNAKAADVDENNTIDVSDYTGIANIIHTGSIYGNSSSAHEMLLSPRRANTDLSAYDNVMYISPFTASAGTQTALSIKMKNTVAIRGFQFDLYLPEGMTVVKSNKGRIQGALSAGRLPDEDEHELTFSEQPDGAIRFLCSSQYDETFTGNDGEIATLQVNIAGTMANGDYPILMKAMKLTETDISKFYTADLIETTVTIGETDTRTVLDENDTTAPANATNVDVRVRRKIKANEWSTLVLPFDMTEAQVKTAFGDDVQLAEFGGWAVTEWNANDEATAIQVTFNNVSAITANTPYVIKVSQAISEFTVDGVDIDVDDEPCVTVGKMGKGTFGSFTGSYVPVTIDDECLFLSDNKFWYSVGNTNMKGFRCYFYFQEVLASFSSGSGAKIGFTVDETNEIYNLTIDNLQFNADAWYSLEGVKLNKKPTKAGVYLHGGKKVVVK